MLKYTISTPWWDGEKVGIAAKRLEVDTMMEVTISYKDKHGNLEYPHRYRMATRKMRKYPTHTTKTGHVKLHIIPIADFEVVT